MSIVDERMETHGDPVESVTRIATRWSRILNHEVTPKQVAVCMAELHVIRANHSPQWNPAHRQHAEGYYEIARLVDARDRGK